MEKSNVISFIGNKMKKNVCWIKRWL